MASEPSPPSHKETMKAWHYTDASSGLERSLKLVQTAKPFPQLLSKSELLIQVLSMSLNPVDYKIPELGLASKLVVSTPATPGYDFCGKVVATHSANDRFTMGQTVFGR